MAPAEICAATFGDRVNRSLAAPTGGRQDRCKLLKLYHEMLAGSLPIVELG